MKKMKFIGLLASVLAISACSLKAQKLSTKDLRPIFDDVYENTKLPENIDDYYSNEKTIKVVDRERTIGELLPSLKEGETYRTSYLDETVYEMKAYKKSNMTVSYVTDPNRNDKFVISISKKHKTYQYLQTKYDAERDYMIADDIAQTGEGVKYSIDIKCSVNKNTGIRRATVNLIKNVYILSGNDLIEDTTKQETSRIANKDIGSDELRDGLAERVNKYFSNEEIKAIYREIMEVYDLGLNRVRDSLINSDQYQEEVFLYNKYYAYRFQKEKLIYEAMFSARKTTAAAQTTTDTSAETSQTSEEAAEEEIVVPMSTYCLVSLVHRDGDHPEKVYESTFANI